MFWKIIFLIVSAFAVSFASNSHKGFSDPQACDIPSNIISEHFEDGFKIKKTDNVCVFHILNRLEEVIATAIYSDPDETVPSGYGGKLKAAVIVDTNDRIVAVVQGENNETGSYLKLLEDKGFYEKWNDLHVEEALLKEVDAVTGATMSSNAITAMVQKNLQIYSGIEKYSAKKTASWISFSDTGSLLIFILGMFLFFFHRKGSSIRIFHLIGAVVVVGFWSGKMLSIEIFRAWLQTGVHQSVFIIFTVAALSMVATFITGRNFYCYYFCPMGAFQELCYKFPVSKLRIKPSFFKPFRFIKRIFLYTLIIMMIFNLAEDFSVFEPFSAFQFKAAAVSSLVLAFSTLAVSFFIPRPWCRFFCPTGEVFDILKKPFRKKIMEENDGET